MNILFFPIFIVVVMLGSASSERAEIQKAENVRKNCAEVFPGTDCARLFLGEEK